MTQRERDVKAALAAVMELEPSQLSLTLTFAEQGLDSLMALRFARKIQDLFGSDIELEWLFDHPTIAQLCRFLDEQRDLH